jgi:hypothetical protein
MVRISPFAVLFTKIVVTEEPATVDTAVGNEVVDGVGTDTVVAGVTPSGVTAVVVCESETGVVPSMHPAVRPAARRTRHTVTSIKLVYLILVTC